MSQLTHMPLLQDTHVVNYTESVWTTVTKLTSQGLLTTSLTGMDHQIFLQEVLIKYPVENHLLSKEQEHPTWN